MSALKASCQCGAVHVEIAHKPEYINDCNCSFCRKSGAIWGYYKEADIKVTGETSSYHRRDLERASIAQHFCKVCGTCSHWAVREDLLDDPEIQKRHAEAVHQCGVNMRLFEMADLASIEVRFPDGLNWDGQTDHDYRRKALVLGKDAY